jgi:hypothetical protein
MLTVGATEFPASCVRFIGGRYVVQDSLIENRLCD